jgi:hypothetical protein
MIFAGEWLVYILERWVAAGGGPRIDLDPTADTGQINTFVKSIQPFSCFPLFNDERPFIRDR